MYQPPPPVVAQPPPTPIKGKRRKGLMIFGIILFLGGLLGGGAIVAKGMANYKDAVKSLARAPVGCTTTLVFDKPATYTVYIETKGKLGSLSGDCKTNGTQYNHAAAKLPKYSITLVDSNGKDVPLQRGVSASYDVDGYVGTAVRTVKIDKAGTYRLNVESDETDFAVAIGKNPKDDSDLLTLIGGAVALGGLVLGLLFFVLGLRRRRPAEVPVDIRNPAGPLPGWPPGPYAGAMPPAPPTHPGLTPEPPPVAPTIQLPGQPPVRLPDQPPGTGFAPPSFAPPQPASAPPPPPPPAPADRGWTVQDEPADDN
ncbi:MAG: hypothetical protein QOE09_2 [Ilumatobacteraceae bacterium]